MARGVLPVWASWGGRNNGPETGWLRTTGVDALRLEVRDPGGAGLIPS